MIDKTPALVVQPTGTADVVEAVNFAREHDLELSVRGGGHNIAGTGLADAGLTIDMSRLRGILVDPESRTATVQAGCSLGEVDRETQLHGLATPLGFVSEVGVAGLTLGGGLGYLTRRFGWAVDNLLEVEIVTADGQIRRAGRDENADLFWAIRGAGANLGVVTSFTFRLHEVGPTVYGGLIAWPFERAAEILRAYRTLTSEAPRELAVWMNLLRAPAAPFVAPQWHGERICAMAVCYSGDLRRVDEALAPIRALGDPVFDLLARAALHRGAVLSRRDRAQGQALLLEDGVPGRAERRLPRDLARPRRGVPEPARRRWASSTSAGRSTSTTPTTGRSATATPDTCAEPSGCGSPTSRGRTTFPQWVRGAWERFRAFSTGGNYVNLQTADEDDERIRATYGANFERLREIKQCYDPGNVFRSNRNIQP